MAISDTIAFIKEIDKLKNIKRKTLNYHQNVEENTAEHSWHLAMAVLISHEFSNTKDIDLLKAIKMALVHDIVEIDAGDQIIYKEDPNKYDREKKAAERIFGLLPDTLKNELINLWQEFEENKTPEAKFVGALDRFLPLMSNHINDGHSWKKFDIRKEQVLKKNKEAISKGSNDLWQTAETMLNRSVSEGHLQP